MPASFWNTVEGGRIDWDDPFAFIMTALKAKQDSDFLKTISHNVTSGSIKAAREGKNLGGVPYGYRSKDAQLVVNEPEAEIVRWLFAAYADTDVSAAELATQLNTRAVPPPGKPRKFSPKWQPNTVRRILTNAKYTGTSVYGKTAKGMFNRIIAGKQQKCKKSDPIQQNTNPADQIRKEGAHTAIVSQELFARVQAKLNANSTGHKTIAAGGGLFSGLLKCGNCGRTLHAKRHEDKDIPARLPFGP